MPALLWLVETVWSTDDGLLLQLWRVGSIVQYSYNAEEEIVLLDADYQPLS